MPVVRDVRSNSIVSFGFVSSLIRQPKCFMLGSRLQIKIGSDSSAVLTVNEFIADASVLARARLSESNPNEKTRLRHYQSVENDGYERYGKR